MGKQIRIRTGPVSMTAELNDSPTAQAISSALPVQASVKTWGDEIYFPIPVGRELEDSAVETVDIGDLGYWPTGRAFCIFSSRFGTEKPSGWKRLGPENVRGALKLLPRCLRVALCVEDKLLTGMEIFSSVE
jgi:hypothetical protein